MLLFIVIVFFLLSSDHCSRLTYCYWSTEVFYYDSLDNIMISCGVNFVSIPEHTFLTPYVL
jgi:hypothetical protein